MIGREKEGSHVFYMLVQLSLKVQQWHSSMQVMNSTGNASISSSLVADSQICCS
jgi:hypothetical protein